MARRELKRCQILRCSVWHAGVWTWAFLSLYIWANPARWNRCERQEGSPRWTPWIGWPSARNHTRDRNQNAEKSFNNDGFTLTNFMPWMGMRSDPVRNTGINGIQMRRIWCEARGGRRREGGFSRRNRFLSSRESSWKTDQKNSIVWCFSLKSPLYSVF